MSDTNSTEVLCERLKGLENLINERFSENKKDHDEIIEKVNKTNGSVADLKTFKIQSRVYFSIIGFVLTSVIIPLIVLFLKKNIGL